MCVCTHVFEQTSGASLNCVMTNKKNIEGRVEVIVCPRCTIGQYVCIHTCMSCIIWGKVLLIEIINKKIFLAPLGKTKNGHHNAAPSINKIIIII